MEQQLGFCTTTDGVRIAYATVGDGPPLVYVTGWPGHLSVEWEKPHSREMIEELAQGVTLVRYDMRGSGLSDRKIEVDDLNLDAWLLDLEAVVDHLKLERFALLSLGFLAGPIAMRYAAAHPDRVTQLILSNAYARGSEMTTPERGRAMVDFISLYGFPVSMSGTDLSREELEKFQDVAKIQKQAAALDVQGQVARTMLSADVSGVLDQLSMPVLIMHGEGDRTVPFELGRDLATRIPHAKFVPFDMAVSAPWLQQEMIVGEIRRFLGVKVEPRPKAAPPPPAREVYTILFTDMESSTALTQRLGDEKAQELVRAHNEIVREALQACGGTEIKHTGDGIMASFPSASRALECAVRIQRAIALRSFGSAQDRQTLGGQAEPVEALGVHIGLNAGEPVAEDEDLFGTAVQLARRICDRAEPGQILASNVVRELAAGKGFLFSDAGESELRGFEDPVRLYEVAWREAGA